MGTRIGDGSDTPSGAPVLGPQIDAANNQSGFICLTLILKFLQIATEPEQLEHSLGKGDGSLEPGDIVRLAKSVGAKSRLIKIKDVKQLEKHPLPAIARKKDGGYFILAQAGDDKVLIQDPIVGKPETWSVDELLLPDGFAF